MDMVRAQPPSEGGTLYGDSSGEFPVRRLPSDSNRPRDIPVYSHDLAKEW